MADASKSRRQKGSDRVARRRPEGAARPNLLWLLHDLEVEREELRNRTQELLEAQIALERDRDFYTDLYDYAPIGYVALDRAGTIRKLNLTATQMIGAERGRLEGWPLQSLVHEEDRRPFLEHLVRCRRAHQQISTELRLKRRSGDCFPAQLLSRPAAAPEGEDVFYRTAIVDRTDQKRIEEALQVSERRLTAAVEASGGGVFEHDIPLGDSYYANSQCAAILGFENEEIPSPPRFRDWLRPRLHREDLGRLERLYAQMGSGERLAYRCDVRAQHRNGEWRWLRVWAKTVHPARPEGTRRVVGVVMDVTEEKIARLDSERRSRQLRALATQLHDVEERERRRLAAELHDDLGQLLAATKMKLELVSSSPEPSREHVEGAIQLLDRASASVRSLSFQTSPPELETLGLRPALETLAFELERQFGLPVVVEESGAIPSLAPRLRFIVFRAVRELLINAAKHAGSPSARVVLGGERGVLKIRVEDEGRGFDPHRIEEETSHGFGLFSIQERMESIGGALAIESAPGRGSRITIVCPVETKARAAAPPRHAEPAASEDQGSRAARHGAEIRVLLADDHELVRNALARTLSSQGDVEVVGEASDGESAIALCGRLDPDVILMDVTMPGLGGIEATRRIKREHPAIRVIGLSMHESENVARAMRDAGASAYLRKSDPAETLLRAIRDHNLAQKDVASRIRRSSSVGK